MLIIFGREHIYMDHESPTLLGNQEYWKSSYFGILGFWKYWISINFGILETWKYWISTNMVSWDPGNIGYQQIFGSRDPGNIGYPRTWGPGSLEIVEITQHGVLDINQQYVTSTNKALTRH